MTTALTNLFLKVAEIYRKKPPSNGPIDNIKRYDWKKDPKGYKNESSHSGLIPYGRCFHCGSQYNNYTTYTAFCNVCERAMHYMSNGYNSEASHAQQAMQDGRNRVSDDRKRTSVYMQ
ncbi:hypothetical protein [Serratia sp. (in: enterobacteria)]|uniref:hypothetical protein n=1 Tax=Serratia sp. (in: enterobacteria) TaxID=616 RepID=UPI0039898BBB